MKKLSENRLAQLIASIGKQPWLWLALFVGVLGPRLLSSQSSSEIWEDAEDDSREAGPLLFDISLGHFFPTALALVLKLVPPDILEK